MDWNLIDHYRNLAIYTFDVDPVVFIALVVISMPFYYYSLFVMGQLIYKLKKKHKLSGKEVLKHKEFLRAFVINTCAWISPYIYVIFWGENLPLWLWALIIFNIGLTAFLFYSKIFKKAREPVAH